MAETLGIIASIGSIVKGLGSSCVLINEIAGASREAQAIADMLQTTDAMLKSLRATMETTSRPQQFLQIWSPLAKDILTNIEKTVELLKKRLGSSNPKTVRLTLWTKVTWPFERGESIQLQHHLQTYVLMLSMVQSAFLQGTTLDVQRSRTILNETRSQLEPLTLSEEFCPSSLWGSSASTVVPDDSASQVGNSDGPPEKPHMAGHHPTKGSESWRFLSKFGWTDWRNPPNVGASYYKQKGTHFTVERFVVRKCHPGRCDADREQSLGSGKLTLALTTDKTSIWIVFTPGEAKDYESRWSPTDPELSLCSCDRDGCGCPMGLEAMEKITVSIFMHGNAPDVPETERAANEDLLIVFKSQSNKRQCYTAFSEMVKVVTAERKRRREQEAAIISASRMTFRT